MCAQFRISGCGLLSCIVGVVVLHTNCVQKQLECNRKKGSGDTCFKLPQSS